MRPSFASILHGPWSTWFRWGPAIPDKRLRAVTFQSVDGIGLAGWYGELSVTAATIILCHGAPGDKRDMAGLAGALMDAGFDVLAFDFRGWGDSGRTRVTLGYREVQDVLGAVEFIRNRRAGLRHSVGVVGLSMGAAAAIIAAAQTPAIDAVVADSSYARLDQSVERITRRVWSPLDLLAARPVRRLGERFIGAPLASVAPVEAIARISPRPVLIIHGEQDRLTHVGDAHALFRACGDPKALWIVEHAGHARTRRAGTEEYDGRIIGFFREHLTAVT
jgi:uncharacterized protein